MYYKHIGTYNSKVESKITKKYLIHLYGGQVVFESLKGSYVDIFN